MTNYRCILIGSGKRVRETALPAFLHANENYQIAGIYARSEKEIVSGGRSFSVKSLLKAPAENFTDVDFVYMAVGKQNVGAVLELLIKLGLTRATLLIDTPVLLLKHFRHYRYIQQFKNAWVAEDCIALPWYDVLHELSGGGVIGNITKIEFERSAYAYHAFAMAKTVLGAKSIASAREERIQNKQTRRTVFFNNQTSAAIVAPRDYASGYFTIQTDKTTISDHEDSKGIIIKSVFDGERCVGFRAGDIVVNLDGAESSLMAGARPGGRVTAHMEPMKRVGFLRLLRRISAGGGAYSPLDGLEDMCVDYFLEKLRRYRSTPFTNIRSGAARAMFTLASRAAGR